MDTFKINYAFFKYLSFIMYLITKLLVLVVLVVDTPNAKLI